MTKPIITFQVNSDQAEELTTYLQKMGITKRSPFLREAIFAYIHSDKPGLKREMLEEFKQTRREFTNAGNNINQVAYKLNAGHPISSEEIRSAQEELQRTFGQMVRFYIRIERNLLGLR